MATTNQSNIDNMSVQDKNVHASKQTLQQQMCGKSRRDGAKADATKTALMVSKSLL